MRAFTIAGVFVFLVTAGAASAQVGLENPTESTPTTLYFHLDAAADFPINTQQPDDGYASLESAGLSRFSTSCVPEPTGQAGFVSQSFHTEYGFSTPGYVEYGLGQHGGPRIHPERGLAADVLLDNSAPIMLYWYLETQVVGDSENTPDDTEAAPVVLPQVTVRATMREGDDISVGAEAYNAGDLIAGGQSEPMTLYPDPANPRYHTLDGGRHLYEFVVEMPLETDRIRADASYNLRVDVFMSVPGCDTDPDESLMASNVRTHTSPAFRPRAELATRNPIWIEYIHPQVVGEALVIHTSMNSPWGNYDVNGTRGGISLKLTGPSEAKSLTRTALVQRHHEHNHHFQPVDVTYSWPYLRDDAKGGVYDIEVRATNHQGTAMAIGRASFDLGRNIGIDSAGNVVEAIEQPIEEDTPMVGFLATLVVLGCAAIVRRR